MLIEHKNMKKNKDFREARKILEMEISSEEYLLVVLQHFDMTSVTKPTSSSLAPHMKLRDVSSLR